MLRSYRPIWWLCLAVLALGVLGCGHVRTRFGAPFESDVPWWTLRSPNFVMHTDLDRATAKATLEGFEARYALLSGVLHPDRSPRPRTTLLVAFRRAEELQSFQPALAGYFMEQLPGSDPMPVIVVAGEPNPYTLQIWQHELTHRLVREALGQLPSWLDEGLAGYYSTATVEGGLLVLGRQPSDIGFTRGARREIVTKGGQERILVPIREVTPPSRLLQTHRHETRGRPLTPMEILWARKANEAVGWAIVHFLINGPPEYNEAFASALAAVAEGRSLIDALRERLRAPDELDRDFVQHLHREHTMTWRTPVQPGSHPPIELERMADAEVLVLLAKLGFGQVSTVELGKRRLSKALRKEPEHPEAIYLRGLFACSEGRWAKCASDLDTAVDLKPDHPGYWTGLLATYELYPRLGGSPETRRTVRERAWDRLAPLARSPLQLLMLAGSLLTHGRAERAKPFARQATVVDPNCAVCFAVLAEIEDELGNREAAVRSCRQAIERAPAHADALRLQLSAQLAGYERQLAR